MTSDNVTPLYESAEKWHESGRMTVVDRDGDEVRIHRAPGHYRFVPLR